jgi:hypothetical protein
LGRNVIKDLMTNKGQVNDVDYFIGHGGEQKGRKKAH